MAKQQPNKIDLLEVYRGLRKVWLINPNSRVKQSKKLYNRNKEKQNFIKELRNG
jgi:hypothetical protein